jgi:hypothetical protein
MESPTPKYSTPVLAGVFLSELLQATSGKADKATTPENKR